MGEGRVVAELGAHRHASGEVIYGPVETCRDRGAAWCYECAGEQEPEGTRVEAGNETSEQPQAIRADALARYNEVQLWIDRLHYIDGAGAVLGPLRARREELRALIFGSGSR